ncbi:MAG: indolepyruvate ferredoxin oxidoreductase subunit alpha [Deltaproteobacteria bacterium]|nr:indolepyruvate ferredoxin oxidoreductase subunit alpha [Deltaproteobacteria bacterium]MBW2659926.1 indolepyruvate ferredoxin oxidoreductase subunit alpha [Deltaproteobacteria bacterium]
MKNMGDMLLRKPGFQEIVMGNTALVRAMVESGTRVITSYPGSPTPEIAAAIQTIPEDERPFYFEFSTNEKVATEVAFGAALNGHLSTVFFKSVGINVAADTFVQLSLLNIIGGMVVVLGDDPGANSSQNEQDNRHFAYLSYTPMLEPASPTEVYRYYKEAAALSQKLGKVIILRLTTHVCHAKEKVTFAEWIPRKEDYTPKFNSKNGPYIPLASAVYPMKKRALRQLGEVETWIEQRRLNTLVENNSTLGIITSGLTYLSLLEILEEAPEKPDILKLAMVYPVPERTIIKFLKSHDEVKIVEELDDELERSIKAIAYDQHLTTRITGKSDIDDWIGEYTPDKVRQILKKTWPGLVADGKRLDPPSDDIPLRPPQMCPGCGHRSAFHAIGEVLAKEDITVADIGCHTLGYHKPYNMGEIMVCMGSSAGIGSGLSLFNSSRKVVAFLGDSTFFHAGLPGIVNALFNKHNLTLILMENGTTAMTGHQDHPASGRNFNEISEAIPIRQVLEGFGVKSIFETDTYDQEKLRTLVKEAINEKQFNVVIAKHPCMLLFAKKQRKVKGENPFHVKIDQKSCDKIHTCIEKFGCPSFTRNSDGMISVNNELCIGDGSCIQTCPRKAITR